MKPISLTASRVLNETLDSNDLNDVSVSIPAPIVLPGTENTLEFVNDDNLVFYVPFNIIQ